MSEGRGIRSFIGLEILSPVSENLGRITKKFKGQFDGIRWVPSGNLHLTLKFIGQIQDIQLPEMCSVLRDVAAQQLPFVIKVRGLDAFPHVGAPRTLWAAIVEGQTELAAICESLDKRLSDFGVRRENRGFRPHITLGRASRVADPESLQAELLQYQDAELGEFHVEELHLYSSVLDDHGAEYDIMDTGVLGEALDDD